MSTLEEKIKSGKMHFTDLQEAFSKLRMVPKSPTAIELAHKLKDKVDAKLSEKNIDVPGEIVKTDDIKLILTDLEKKVDLL